MHAARLAVLLWSIAVLAAGTATAQSYPSRNLRLLVGFAAGGPSDVQARLLARELSADLGQSVVVENRPGAAGVIALDLLPAAAADGYTILLLSNTTTTALHFQKRTLEPEKQFTAIGGTHVTPMLLLVNPSKVNARNLGELIAFLKANPGTDFTSSGPGSPGHMGMAFMAKERSLQVTHIPHKGVGPALADVLAGRIPILIADSATSKGAIASGLRAVAAVASVRSPIAPDVPTTAEQGVANFANDSFAGIVLPPRTPAAILERLRPAVQKAALSESYAGHQRTSGSQAKFTDGPAFVEALQRDFERWGRAIRELGVQAE